MKANSPRGTSLSRCTNHSHQKSNTFKAIITQHAQQVGDKVGARCGISGILYDFEIYTGRTDKAQAKPELLMGGNEVNRLMRTLPMNVNCKVYFDIFFPQCLS